MIRLLNINTLQLREFDDNDVPPYAIASHRWQQPDEITKKDLEKNRNTDCLGFAKVQGFCNFLVAHRDTLKSTLHDSIDWVWIDTCCIDRKNAVELAEAINSMFTWYSQADICLVYLYDVNRADEIGFESSAWHRRGWTLQELIAPDLVFFLDSKWQILGHKSNHDTVPLNHIAGEPLHDILTKCTGVPVDILRKILAITNVSVEERLAWMKGRATMKVEDQAYCLLGIFGVFIPIIYGERHLAKIRLLEEVFTKYGRRKRKRAQDAIAEQQMSYIQTQLIELEGEDDHVPRMKRKRAKALCLPHEPHVMAQHAAPSDRHLAAPLGYAYSHSTDQLLDRPPSPPLPLFAHDLSVFPPQRTEPLQAPGTDIIPHQYPSQVLPQQSAQQSVQTHSTPPVDYRYQFSTILDSSSNERKTSTPRLPLPDDYTAPRRRGRRVSQAGRRVSRASFGFALSPAPATMPTGSNKRDTSRIMLPHSPSLSATKMPGYVVSEYSLHREELTTPVYPCSSGEENLIITAPPASGSTSSNVVYDFAPDEKPDTYGVPATTSPNNFLAPPVFSGHPDAMYSWFSSPDMLSANPKGSELSVENPFGSFSLDDADGEDYDEDNDNGEAEDDFATDEVQGRHDQTLRSSSRDSPCSTDAQWEDLDLLELYQKLEGDWLAEQNPRDVTTKLFENSESTIGEESLDWDGKQASRVVELKDDDGEDSYGLDRNARVGKSMIEGM